jgi:radical SAM protein with 4Fe4S-binding SPASM domain
VNPPIPEQEYKDFSRRIWDKSMTGPLPTRVQFEITYRCNIHCVHCYTDPFNNPKDIRKELSFEEILRIFDELREAGVLWMLLTGGEAVVHPRFKEIYREAKARGFIVSLFSNGTTITDDLADFLASDPPFQLEVSCHGATDATFDTITQIPGSFQHFQEGINRILARGLPLKIKTKAMKENQHELVKIKEFIESLGFDFNLSATIQPRLNGDLSSTDHRLAPDEVVELEFGNFLETEEKDCGPKERGDFLKPLLQPPADDRLFRCGCGTNFLTISPHGVLRACTFTTWPQYALKTFGVREAFEKLVAGIRGARYTGNSPCQICPVYTLCDKNPAMAVRETGSMEAPIKHFCTVAYGRASRLTSAGL